jgi:LysR family transcriptional regulator, glycine cleavage system transcriptional activator
LGRTIRRLPPLNAIRAFEATARHLSFTKAAQELCVTQGAISRHVAALETGLGTKLFERRHRAIELTPKGEIYFRALRDAFERIEDATEHVTGIVDTPTLRIKLPPTFAIRWIVPRLARLHAIDRSLDVQITTSHSPADFDREEIDVAIHSGEAPVPGTAERPPVRRGADPGLQPRPAGERRGAARARRSQGAHAALLAAPAAGLAHLDRSRRAHGDRRQ